MKKKLLPDAMKTGAGYMERINLDGFLYPIPFGAVSEGASENTSVQWSDISRLKELIDNPNEKERREENEKLTLFNMVQTQNIIIKELKAEPTTAMIDAGVAFALKVSLSADYTWPQYIKDLYMHMNEHREDYLK